MDLSTTQVQPYHYPTGLIGHSLQGVEVKASDWDASVADVRRALAGTIYELKQMDVGPEKNPTYFFKTRDGTEGILQLLQVTDNPKGIRLRFKTLPRGQKVHGRAHMALPTTGSAQAANKSNFEHDSGLELRLAYTEPAEGRIESLRPGARRLFTSSMSRSRPVPMWQMWSWSTTRRASRRFKSLSWTTRPPGLVKPPRTSRQAARNSA